MQVTLLPPKNAALCAPITANRKLAACLIANVPMIDLLAAEFTRAGMQLVANDEAGSRTLRIPIDTWIEQGAMIGDGVRTGVNTSIEAGVKIGVARTTKPGSYIEKDLL